MLSGWAPYGFRIKATRAALTVICHSKQYRYTEKGSSNASNSCNSHDDHAYIVKA